MNKRLSMSLLLVILLCAVSAFAQGGLFFDPEIYFVVANDATGSDIALRDAIVAAADDQLDLDVLVTAYKSTTDSDVNRNKASKATTVVIYKGEVLVVTGDASPPHVQQAAQSLFSLIKSDFGIDVQQLTSSALTNDALITHVVLPATEVVFVMHEPVEISDDLLMKMLVQELEYLNIANATPSSFLKNADVNVAYLQDKVTVFIHRGDAAVVIGNSVSSSAVDTANNITDLLQSAQFEVPTVANLSAQVLNDDLRLLVAPDPDNIQFPEVYFVLDQPRTQLDTLLFNDIIEFLQLQSLYTLVPTNYYLNQDVAVNQLDYRNTVFLSGGNSYLIVGENSPEYQERLHDELEFLLDGLGLRSEKYTSNAILVDNLTEALNIALPAPPQGVAEPELLFVVDDNVTFGDQGLLATILADLEDQNQFPLPTYGLRVNSNVTLAELDYRVTVFVNKGEVLIITGSHSPQHQLDLASDLSEFIYNTFEIETQNSYSNQIYSHDLTESVFVIRQNFNTITFFGGINTPFNTPLESSFIEFGPNGTNTSGRIVITSFNLSNDPNEYAFEILNPQFAETIEGEYRILNNQIREFTFEVQDDKMETWNLGMNQISKTYTFNGADGSLRINNASNPDNETSGQLNLTVYIDGIHNFSDTYLMNLSGVDGQFVLFPQFSLGFVDTRQLSLRGMVYTAIGKIQEAGSVVATGNLGSFIAPIVNGRYFITMIHEAMGDHFFYKVSHIEAYNSTIPPAQEPPVALFHDLVVNQTQRGEYVNLVDVPRQLQYPHFGDDDNDGVPNQIDLCPDTVTMSTQTLVTSSNQQLPVYIFRDDVGGLVPPNTSLGLVRPNITESNTPFLENYTLGNEHGFVDIYEYIHFATGEGFISNLSVTYGVDANNQAGEFLHATSGADLFEYEQSFEGGWITNVSGADLTSYVGDSYQFLGRRHVVTQATLNANQMELYLTGARIYDTIKLGEEKTYQSGNDSVTFAVLGYDNATQSFNVTIDGNLLFYTSGVTEYATNTSTLLVVRPTKKNELEIAFGLTQLRFTDDISDNLFTQGGLYVDGQQIDGSYVSLRGVLNAGLFTLNHLKYRLHGEFGSPELYVAAQQGIRDYLKDPQAMLTDTWDIFFDGDNQIVFTLHAPTPPPPLAYYVQLQSSSGIQTQVVNQYTFGVDQFGCSCAQKNCAAEGLGCIESMGQAVCAPTCNDGFMNGQETGIDCGLACGKACPVNQCNTPNQCIGNAPGYCNDQLMPVENCAQCGCPAGQTCTGNGSCSLTLPPHCYNGVLDGDERGVDCGGSCFGLCPGDPCDNAGICLPPMPAYCNDNFEVELNCPLCGCPAGNNCDANSGRCLPPPQPPVNTCGNGIQDGDERGIDCGGSCTAFCPDDECFDIGQCRADQPTLCTDQAELELNCGQCGCPFGFTCQADGHCSIDLPLTGKKCVTSEVFVHKGGGTCAEIMQDPSWRTEPAQNYVDAKLVGNVGIGYEITFGFFGKSEVKKIIKKTLRDMKICIREEDMGCYHGQTVCPMDSVQDEIRAEIGRAVYGQTKSQMRKRVPSIFKNWPWNFHPRVKVNMQHLPLSTDYTCDTVTLNSTALPLTTVAPLPAQAPFPENHTTPGILHPGACQAFIENGHPNNKIDILLLGDGYASGELGFALMNIIADQLIDPDSARAGTSFEGLYSKDPWASLKDNINIWVYPSANEVMYYEDQLGAITGTVPTRQSVMFSANHCPQADMVVLLSDRPFRSHCWAGYPGPCMISLVDEDHPGVLLAHELGHGIGVLADEYYERVNFADLGFVTLTEQAYAKSKLGANCQANQANAQATWGDLADDSAVGYFTSCGGPCSESCADFVRPTLNSMMNHHLCTPGSLQVDQYGNVDQCSVGPPYPQWHAVNARQLNTILNNPQITPQNGPGFSARFSAGGAYGKETY